MMSAKPVSYIPHSPRLLDQLREVLRYRHYSLRYTHVLKVAMGGTSSPLDALLAASP